jgi:ABC-2 type transport system ATP-binding protein
VCVAERAAETMLARSMSAGEVIVDARGLVKRFGSVVAVDGLDLEVRAGTCLGLLGPNGAGKTTTIEMLEGLKRPDAGTIRVLGLAWDDAAPRIRAAIGVQLQATEFQEKLTVFETLRMFTSFYRATRDPAEVIAWVGLEEKRASRVGTLSGGQKQRLALGCALLNRPRILFLDEPTTGLDPQARRRVWELVEAFKAEGGTALLTTHYMEEAERLADDLAIVDHGKVIARGSPRAVIDSLHAESVVDFAPRAPTGAGAGVLSDAELRALPGVSAVRRDGERVVLSVNRTEDAIAGLFACLSARGLAIEDLRTHRPTLEDVFVALTGKHLRDE